jgi:hypothetical protein
METVQKDESVMAEEEEEATPVTGLLADEAPHVNTYMSMREQKS